MNKIHLHNWTISQNHKNNKYVVNSPNGTTEEFESLQAAKAHTLLEFYTYIDNKNNSLLQN